MHTKISSKAALLLGNVLEWYDFAIYGFFAHIFAHLFFPHLSKPMAMLAAIAGFSIGFIMRPLGGWLLGALGDAYGKRKALLVSLTLMFFPALAICITPTYAQIGLWAPCILLLSRLLQGFSGGGELVNVSFTLFNFEEHPGLKFSLLSFGLASAYSGVVLAAITSFFLVHFSSANFLLHTAWRLAFAVGAFISITGLIWRYCTLQEDEPALQPTPQDAQVPYAVVKTILTLICLVAPAAFVNYFLVGFIPSLLIVSFKLPPGGAALYIGICMAVTIVTMYILQKYIAVKSLSKLRYMLLILLLILCWPVMHALFASDVVLLILSLFALSVFFGAYAAPMLFDSLYRFPKQHQLKYFGIAYNLSYVVFGGTAPLISQALHEHTNLLALYLAALVVLALITTVITRKRSVVA